MVDDAVDANLGTALADPEFQAEYEAQRQAEDEVSRAQTNMEAQELVGEMTRRSGLGTRFDPATTLEVGNRYLENVQTVLRAEGYDEQQIEELTGTPEFSEAIVAEVLEARRIDAVKERALSIVGRRP